MTKLSKNFDKTSRSFTATLITILLLVSFFVTTIIMPSSHGSLPEAALAKANEIKNSPIKELDIKSTYAILIDADSGNVLYDQGSDEQIYPASTTKILTAIVALENSDLDDVITVSENALKGQENGGTHIGLEAGEKLTMNDALYGMMLESANDCAIAIAEYIGGSEDGFAELLNEKAKELGLKDSHFVTSNGFFHEDHYTTARDLATLTQYAIKNEDFLKIFSAYKYTLAPTNKRSEPLDIYTTHALAKYKSMAYDAFVGGKTGYIEESKINLVSLAEKNNIRLICVTAKCGVRTEAFNDSKKLFEAGFNNYKSVEVKPDSSSPSLEKMLKKNGYVIKRSSIGSEEISAVIPNSANAADVTFELVEEENSFPIKKGALTATINAVYDGDVVGSIQATADKDMSLAGFIITLALKIIACIFIVLLVLILVLRVVFTIKRKRRKRI